MITDPYYFLATRHSVRSYLDKPIEEKTRELIERLIENVNNKFKVKFRVFFNYPNAFKLFPVSRIKFKGPANLIVFYHPKAAIAGYLSALVLLKLHAMKLSTCYVGVTYRKLLFRKKGEKIQCALAFGYGEDKGKPHKNKDREEFYDLALSGDLNLNYILRILMTAPSSLNHQGIRLVKKNNQFAVVKTENNPFSNFDLGIYRYYLDLALGRRKL